MQHETITANVHYVAASWYAVLKDDTESQQNMYIRSPCRLTYSSFLYTLHSARRKW